MGSFDLAGELANTTAEERGTKLHDEGDYNFGVVSAKDEGESKNGSPTLGIVVEFLEGPYRGHRVNKKIYYSNKSQGGIRFFWQQLKGLGIEEEYLQASGQTTFDQIALLAVGVQFAGKIRHREFPVGEGSYQEEVVIGKPISNPNVGGTAVTGVVQPPAGPAPELFDDEDGQAPATTSPATPEVSPPAQEAEAEAVDADDPWAVGAGSK